MPIEQQLQRRRVAVLAADGFEKVELTAPVAALRAAGADVNIVSLRHGRIRGVNLYERASRVSVDHTIGEVSEADYDALFIPGGFISPDLLRQSAAARQFVREFNSSGKPIATLCRGPWVLSSAGLTKGRRMTSWPGVRDDLVNAGAVWVDQDVVRDGNWLTSRGPQDMAPFVKALVAFFAGQAEEAAPNSNAVTSSPQRQEPPSMGLDSMKGLARPSFRAAAVVGALFAAYAWRRRAAT